MKLEQAVDYLARLQGMDEIPVSEAARRLKKTSFWVHQNFPIIVHGPKSHHVKLSAIEAYQQKRTVFRIKKIGNLETGSPGIQEAAA